MRWIRLLWPEMVFGGMWIALLCLGHTVFTDDEMWQHAAIDALEWGAFFGYVIAVFATVRRGRIFAETKRYVDGILAFRPAFL